MTAFYYTILGFELKKTTQLIKKTYSYKKLKRGRLVYDSMTCVVFCSLSVIIMASVICLILNDVGSLHFILQKKRAEMLVYHINHN